MRDALKSYLALAGGVTDLTRQRAVAAAKALVSQGEATAEQVAGLAEDLLSQTRQNREAVVALVASEVDRALGRVGLAMADEVSQLTGRIRELEQELRTMAVSAAASRGLATAAAAPDTGGQAKAAPAKKAAPTKSAAPAKKTAPAKKAAPTKSAAPAKKTAPAKASGAAPKQAAPAKEATATEATGKEATGKEATGKEATGTQASRADGS